ncbi:MAG: hydrogenase nickel incorporation protein HypB [Syntrophaceae bacterium]|jgi:hydrogenase nickel incorporation protein HypB|nr:hydrogenase nickel incorporation protein HypB [Syntrophaceae bacterium]HOG10967.1 hydrogenase nickel incorporation protein HypB [Smithella sp.]HOS15170.1 hydrogenase nickel incorporation protein HypB [Smithella sp.]HPL48834.1 hydrogenase nickel incorporation protein HypB [Smithella sp.]HPN87323.1 hydrogenase nickel incorporation protein HypB [Smithella sp.]
MAEVRLIEVKEEILADNIKVAAGVRENLQKTKTMLVNLMSSPGSGKTSLILQTIAGLKDSVKLGVIEADIDSMVDAEKVAAKGIRAVQLKTGGFCHLDATMVTQGIDALSVGDLDLVIIENVGNLVCPAEFDTGAHKNVMILSVPEGDDKPLKYPLMFSICDVLLVNKIDYLSLSDFDMEAMRKRVLALNPKIEIIEVSCKTGAGIDQWVGWLKKEVAAFKNLK